MNDYFAAKFEQQSLKKKKNYPHFDHTRSPKDTK